jgi:hypothetical protein
MGVSGRFMKYFTTDWVSGKFSVSKAERIKKQYSNYLDQIFPSLPFTLKNLSRNISLHDGIIENFCYDDSQNILTLDVFGGNLQSGYFIIILKYVQVEILKMNNKINSGDFLEIITNELEIIEKRMFSHKILFSNKNEIEIIFHDLTIHLSNKTPEDYEKVILKDPFLQNREKKEEF